MSDLSYSDRLSALRAVLVEQGLDGFVDFGGFLGFFPYPGIVANAVLTIAFRLAGALLYCVSG